MAASTILGPTYGRILNKKVTSFASSSISLVSSKVPAPIFGSFITNGDMRITTTYRREILGRNLAITTSFNPATLKCGCKEAAAVLRRRDAAPLNTMKGRVIVLADHCFSPNLTVTDHSSGDCLAIMRIEHGDLHELADLFFSLIDIYKIHRGTIILLTSVSHLAQSSLDAYAADMANIITRIKGRLSGTVEAFPIAPLLLGGCEDQSLTRAIFDSCLWLKAIPGYLFVGYTDAIISAMLADGTGGAQPAYRAHHRLPLDMDFSFFKNVSCSGHPGLCKKIRPMEEQRENPSVSKLLCELSTSFDMPVCLAPMFGRLPSAENQGEPRVMVVGASHAARVAEQLSKRLNVVNLCVRGWRAGKAAGDAMAQAIMKALEENNGFDLIVLQLFDNTSFYARTCEGGLIPCRRELNSNTYHVDGDLVLQPVEALERSFEDCRPIFRACGDNKMLLLSPLPRYITAGCCNDEEHAPNRVEKNFRSVLISGLERTKKNIKMLVENSGLHTGVVFNPLWLIAGPKKKSEAEILQIIEDGWGTDPVHPNTATYEKLAEGITSQGLIGPRSVFESRLEGIGLLSDLPEWQRACLSSRGKRPGGFLPPSNRGKFHKRI
jgi:hypothetical protein